MSYGVGGVMAYLILALICAFFALYLMTLAAWVFMVREAAMSLIGAYRDDDAFGVLASIYCLIATLFVLALFVALPFCRGALW